MNPPSDTVRCICGQLNPADAELCSNCKEPLALVPYRSEAPASEPATGFSLVRLLLVIGVVAIVIAIFVVMPGLTILLAALALPALIRTSLMVQRRKKLGKKVSTDKSALLFMASFVATVLVTTVVGAICYRTFCGVAEVIANNWTGGYPDPVIVCVEAGIVTLIVAIALLVPVVMWIRWRWKKDTTNP
jgi:hypothetical protein